jgi:hypothetical protein
LNRNPEGWKTLPIKLVHSRNRVLREICGDAGREAYTGSQQAVLMSPEIA